MSDSAQDTRVSMADAEVLSSTVIADGPKRFVRERLRMPDGHEIDWDYIDTPSSVLVVPVTRAGTLVMIRQYRHNLREHVYEFPAGVTEPGEEPEAAALRELREETGYAPAEGCRLLPLGAFYSMPSETNRRTSVFLCTAAERVGNPEPDNLIEKYFDMEVRELFPEDALAAACGMEAVAVLSLARPHVPQWA